MRAGLKAPPVSGLAAGPTAAGVATSAEAAAERHTTVVEWPPGPPGLGERPDRILVGHLQGEPGSSPTLRRGAFTFVQPCRPRNRLHCDQCSLARASVGSVRSGRVVFT